MFHSFSLQVLAGPGVWAACAPWLPLGETQQGVMPAPMATSQHQSHPPSAGVSIPSPVTPQKISVSAHFPDGKTKAQSCSPHREKQKSAVGLFCLKPVLCSSHQNEHLSRARQSFRLFWLWNSFVQCHHDHLSLWLELEVTWGSAPVWQFLTSCCSL